MCNAYILVQLKYMYMCRCDSLYLWLFHGWVFNFDFCLKNMIITESINVNPSIQPSISLITIVTRLESVPVVLGYSAVQKVCLDREAQTNNPSRRFGIKIFITMVVCF